MNTAKLSNYGNRLLASLVSVPACQTAEADTDWFPAVDITGAGPEYLVEVDLPGLTPEQI